MLLAVLDRADAARTRNIVSVGLGGTNVAPSLVLRVQQELDAVASITFGQSECPIISFTDASDDVDTIVNTVGRPVPHTDVKIAQPDSGVAVPLGAVGEVCVRSPLVMDGYFAMPEATAATIDAEGFLHTGDLGSMDPHGVITIRGRAREVIIRGGENIYPIEVENVLSAHPGVAGVAVLGVPDAKYGELVGAAVQRFPDATVTAGELEAFAATKLAAFKVPRVWRFVEQFPLTASNKIRKIDLSEQFQADPID